MNTQKESPGILANKAADAFDKKDFPNAISFFSRYLDSNLRMEAILGTSYSYINLNNFEATATLLENAAGKGKYEFRKISYLLLGYSYLQLDRLMDARDIYQELTEIVRKGNDDEFELDNEEENDEDGAPAYDEYIEFYTELLMDFPAIPEGWVDFLISQNNRITTTEQAGKLIAAALYDYGHQALKQATKLKKSGLPAEKVWEAGNKFLDASLQYNAQLESQTLYIRGNYMRGLDDENSIKLLEASLAANPLHADSLKLLATLYLNKEDYDKAVTLINQCATVYEEQKAIKGPSLTDIMADVYFKAAFHFAETGAYAKGEENFRKYFQLKQPEVYNYITRSGNSSEDVWTIMSEGYVNRAFPYQEAAEAERRSLLFADIAICVSATAKTYSLKAMLLNNLSRYEEALACYEKGLMQDPHHYYLLYTGACILSGMNAPREKVLSVIRQSLQANPAFASTLRNEPDFGTLRSDPAFLALFR